jgi:predicted GNAT family acetyltransferase
MSESTVVVNDDLGRFETTVDGHTAHLTFRRNGGRLILIHTEVPPSLEGRGVGSVIVRGALDYARENKLTIVPECEFARGFIERHPDETDGIDVELPSAG